MAKVITFSRTFPAYHPKAGQPTYFVEKFLASINYKYYDEDRQFSPRLSVDSFEGKHHTIRSGNRWKEGMLFSPRVWSGTPYKSPQITIAPDTLIKKVWNVEIFLQLGCIYIGIRKDENTHELLPFGEVAQNDGLTFDEMQDWFDVKPGKPFVGQIICWNDSVNYDKY